jgi:hypothetical protein
VHWGVLSANLLSGLAVVVAVVGVWRTDKRARGAEDRARHSDDAAARSANASERMAEALERQAIETEQRASSPGVAWKLEHFQNDSYLLSNAGRAPAYEVRVETGNLLGGDVPEQLEMRPDDAVKLLAIAAMSTMDDTVKVTWADRPGATERRSWSRPLPPRPPRH